MAPPSRHDAEIKVSEARPEAPEFVRCTVTLRRTTAIPPRKPISAPPPILAAISIRRHAAALQLIREEIGDCTRCALHKGRNKLVFADGDRQTRG